MMKYSIYLGDSQSANQGYLMPVDVMIYSNNSVVLDVITIILIVVLGLTIAGFSIVMTLFLFKPHRRLSFYSKKKNRVSLRELSRG
jgi:hypothetical protein